MAELRKISERSALSNVSRVTPQGGTVFAGLATIMEEAYRALEPAALQESERMGLEQGMAEAEADLGPPRPNYALYDEGPGPEGRVSSSSPLPEGTDWLEYANQNAIRNDPLSDRLIGAMSFLPEMGIRMRVTSGGQENNTTHGTGSTRHNHGNAGDVEFVMSDGTVLDGTNPEHRPIIGQIVQRARANGVDGWGWGEDYMGATRFHLGFGNPAVWGAGGRSANVADWFRDVYTGGGPQLDARVSTGGLAPVLGEPDVQAPQAARPAEQPTTVRTAEGRIERRRFSPLSPAILQAHNAAADVAYASAVTNRFTTDMLAISSEMIGNPEGIRQRGAAMIDQMVGEASPAIRSQLRVQLEQELAQRYRGAVDEQHREVRQRAANENLALINRYTDDFADALVTGNQDEIAAARQRLQESLAVRQRLPGLAFTQAQADNIMIGAMDAADQMRERARNEQAQQWGDELRLVIESAQNGLTAAAEELIYNPQVQAAHPELAMEAAAMVDLRDSMPEFFRMNPAMQRETIEELRSQPIENDYEIARINALERAHGATLDSLEEPMSYAQEHRPTNPPPALPGIEASETQFRQAMDARRRYAEQMVMEGYAERPVYFTPEERQQWSALIGSGVEPEIRAHTASLLVEAFGTSAGRVMAELSADPGLRHGAMIAAQGGDTQLVADIINGEAAYEQGLVQKPAHDAMAAATEDFFGDGGGIPNNQALRGAIQRAAQALYALQPEARTTPPQDAEDVFGSVLQRAMGQTLSPQGVVRGGVQDLYGSPTLLPPSLSADVVNRALNLAIGDAGQTRTQGATQRTIGAVEAQPERWGGDIPVLNGEPITQVQMENIRLVPIVNAQGEVTSGIYRMEYSPNGTVYYDVERQSDGGVFFLNLNTLTEGLR